MSLDVEFPGLRRSLMSAAIAVAAVGAALMLGQLATYPNLVPWYAGLTKPPFNPPNWLFAPVWTALYALMAFAAWKILQLPPSPERRRALILFFAQLTLNALWSWMFFAAQSPLLGLVNIGPQLAVIAACILAFGRLDRNAALSLAPLFAWVAFASLLNFEIWRLNG